MGPSVVDDVTRKLLQQTLDRLADLPNGLRTALADHQWAQIALYVDEFAAGTVAAGGAVQVRAQTAGVELITSVVASLPTGAAGTITLGVMTIPVGAGVTVIAPVQKILGTSDVRSLTSTAAGAAFLWLTGQQLPSFGVLAH